MGQQMTTYSIMLSGVAMLLYLTGLDNGNNLLLNIMFDWSNISTTAIWITLFGGMLSGVGAIVVGFFTKNVELSAMSAVVPTVFGSIFLPPFIGLIQVLWTVAPVMAYLIVVPLLVGFIMMSIEYWRGRD